MNQAKKTKKKSVGLTDISKAFAKYKLKDKGGYITQEFQDFGYRMAVELEDTKRVSLYMRLAKKESRGTLESALSFVSDSNARNKAALFMWKLKQMREERKNELLKGDDASKKIVIDKETAMEKQDSLF